MSLEALIGPSRLPQVGTTIFTVMSQLAAQYAAVNLGQGFPDWDCAPELKALVAGAIDAGHNQYAPMAGVAALREQLALKQARLYGHEYDPDSEITITAGATQAIMTAILALVHAGDEVIVLDPVYDSYLPSIELAAGRPVRVALHAADGFRIDWDRVHAALSPRTRMMILNFPHNPTGVMLQSADIAALEAIVARHRLLLLSDEVYEHIVFDGRRHLSLACSPQLAQRTLVVSSFGKTLHATGWKIGYCCAPAPLTAEFRKVHQFMVFAVNTPLQHALAHYLADPDPAPYLKLPRFYQEKRDAFVCGLAATRLRALPCAATYFVLADYSAVSDESDADFAERLVREHQVASIPLSALCAEPGRHRLVRFCFAKSGATLQLALERLARV